MCSPVPSPLLLLCEFPLTQPPLKPWGRPHCFLSAALSLSDLVSPIALNASIRSCGLATDPGTEVFPKTRLHVSAPLLT